MGSMSDIRKDIMARLGAIDSIGDRPGAKAKMGMPAKWQSEDRYIDQRAQQEDEPNAPSFKQGKYIAYVHYRNRSVQVDNMLLRTPPGQYRNELEAYLALVDQKIAKYKNSRPGAKAKMGKWTVVMPSIPDAGTRHFDSWEQAKKYVDTKMGGFTALVSVDGKRYALKHALGQWEKFSRPGAKAKMAVHAGALAMAQANYNRAKRELDEAQERLDAFIRLGHSEQRIAQAERGVEIAEQRLKDAEKALRSLNSRPGAKAKFMRFIDVLSWPGEHGSTYEAVISDDAGRFQPSVTRQDRDGSEQYLTRYAPTFKTEAGARKWLQAKIAEMKAQHRASRPGAKARFGTEVGRKGNKSAMITRDGTGTWYAYVVQRTETGIGKAEDMLGTMRAYATEDRAKRAAIKALDTSGFSRPGAKAKFEVLNANYAKMEVRYMKPDGQTETEIVSGSARAAVSSAIRRIEKMGDGAKVWVKAFVPAHPLGRFPAFENVIWKGEVKGGRAYEHGGAFSRPGAKVKAGRAEDLYRKLSSGSITYANAKEWERLVTEALRLPDYTPPGGDMSLHEIAEDLGGDLMALKTHSGPVPHAKAKAEKASDLEREDVKAGLKVMAASDPAVSDKIRTLIAEGKPQDQAVAIALDMKRRGEI